MAAMEIQFPPPHMLFHEPMEDREMIRIWKEYTASHPADIDTFEVPATVGVPVIAPVLVSRLSPAGKPVPP